jgi:hypothetical protein
VFLSSRPPLPEDGSRTSFRNVVILIVVILFFGRRKKSRNPLLHNIVHRRQNLLEFSLREDLRNRKLSLRYQEKTKKNPSENLGVKLRISNKKEQGDE